jgi:hypothetical protein
MKDQLAKNELPPGAGVREIFQTVTGSPPVTDYLATRLQYVADLLAALGRAPESTCLVWREAASGIRQERVGAEVVVGRQPGGGLAFAEDDLLSRRHFSIRVDGSDFLLEDLQSRNGTAVNTSENRIRQRVLCDGDLIYAGRHIFVFLNPAGSDRS